MRGVAVGGILVLLALALLVWAAATLRSYGRAGVIRFLAAWVHDVAHRLEAKADAQDAHDERYRESLERRRKVAAKATRSACLAVAAVMNEG